VEPNWVKFCLMYWIQKLQSKNLQYSTYNPWVSTCPCNVLLRALGEPGFMADLTVTSGLAAADGDTCDLYMNGRHVRDNSGSSNAGQLCGVVLFPAATGSDLGQPGRHLYEADDGGRHQYDLEAGGGLYGTQTAVEEAECGYSGTFSNHRDVMHSSA
jgi:hypothetical protein